MTTTSAAEKKFTMSKSLGALIIALLAGAFFAGTRARGESEHASAERSPVAAAALGSAPLPAPPPSQSAPVIEAVTAEQVRQLVEDMRDLKRKLETASTQMGELNTRLARLEGAYSIKRGQ